MTLVYKILLKSLIIITGCVALFACSSTKQLTDNQLLLTKTKVRYDVQTIKKEDINPLVKQEPNYKLLGLFRLNLAFYTHFSKSKPSKFHKWIIDNLSEPPVIYDLNLSEKTKERLHQYFTNKGYFNAEVVKTEKIKHKKIQVLYKVKAYNPYTIKAISVDFPDSTIKTIIESGTTLIHPSDNFDIGKLEDERTQMVNLLKHNGYYQFNNNDINFEADSSLGNNQVNLTIHINQPQNTNDTSKSVITKHKKYKINNTWIFTNFDFQEMLKDKAKYLSGFDTVKLQENIYELTKGKRIVRPSVIQNCNFIVNNDYYNSADVEKTKQYLTKNRILKQVTIDFKEIANADTLADFGLLDCYIQISSTTKQNITINLEGTSTGGDMGAQVKVSYENKNIFNGAEVFKMNFRYTFEQDKTASTDLNNKIFNSQVFGADVGLEIPKLILPITAEQFSKDNNINTFIKAGYSLQKISYYTCPVEFLSFGYVWKNSKYLTQKFALFDISGVAYKNPSSEFQSFIAQETYFKYSYEDYYISTSNYTLTWQNKDPNKFRDYFYVNYYLESAGNALYAFSKLTNKHKINGSYEMFGTPFAQYAKTDIDMRYYNVQSKESATVYRIFLGIAQPYGNNDIVPSIKQYYCGGSNSMRAWSLRSLGPGSTVDTSKIKYSFGSIKLETNLEQRFPIFKFLNGAFFIDAGNIWSNQKSDTRSGALFNGNFYKDIAIGVGTGLRFNFSFFVFRLDLALQTRNPAQVPGNRWVWEEGKINWNETNLTIGIGYPF